MGLPYDPIDRGEGDWRFLLRGSRMPLTGVLLTLFIVSVVLFAQSPTTYLIATFLGVALALAFVLELSQRRGGLCFPAPLLWFAAFVCFCMLQMIWSPGPFTLLLTLLQLLVMTVVIVGYGVSTDGVASIEYALYVAVLATFVYNIVGTPQTESGRIGSTLLNANAYAFVLLLGSLFAIRRVLMASIAGRMKYRTLILSVLYVGLSLYGIVYLTVSRKGIISSVGAVAILGVYWVWQQPIRRRVLLTVVVLAVFGLLGYGLYRSPQFARIVELSDYLGGKGGADYDLVYRGNQLKNAVRLWLEHPFLGVGLDQFRVLSGGSMQSYSFNNYAELLANHGIIGFFAYIMVYVSAFVSLVRSFRLSRDSELSAEVFWSLTVLVVMAGWDLASVNYSSKETWITLGVVIAVSARASLKVRKAGPRAAPWLMQGTQATTRGGGVGETNASSPLPDR